MVPSRLRSPNSITTPVPNYGNLEQLPAPLRPLPFQAILKTEMPKKILVAEDEPGYLDLLQISLSTEGYEVIPVDNGSSALKRAVEELPDLVLTDVRMPGLDGYHFAQSLADALGARCPKIIIMTSRDTSSAREKGAAMMSGAHALVQKPFELPELHAKIKALLEEGS
ncbi:MAG: two-component system response regulator [Elusimicrobia bacterium CG_4_9_14_3_um_filter_62_55]|nr:MAG: two-component system response regulator [Elusimicrobia bacterium CG22_combo_CG10-13_8_21_14_all_63_91]PJA16802.1 MAG: two-component system response regulator [Elusimicrobia bacterium CG_4_10_14_0_2_um_filter_63_34]PJB24760.1 MAG: two-component system response regulator [Elusimicrobia bacterium CG_4_9_14_3_um_filter_62_55]